MSGAVQFVPRTAPFSIEGMGGEPARVGIDFKQSPWPENTIEQAARHYLNRAHRSTWMLTTE